MTPARAPRPSRSPITLAIQIFTSLAATATSVLAPEIAATSRLPPTLVGVFVGIVYAGVDGRRASAAARSSSASARFACRRCASCSARPVSRWWQRGAARPLPSLLLLVAAPSIIGLGYGPDHAGVVARADPHRVAGTDGADVFDQADRRSGGRRARRRAAAGLALVLGWRRDLCRRCGARRRHRGESRRSTRATFDSERVGGAPTVARRRRRAAEGRLASRRR